PPLNDITASINMYPIAEFTPNKTASANLAGENFFPAYFAASNGVVTAEDGGAGDFFARILNLRRRFSMYW
ncbi:hypothetical protein ABTG52_19230, partial [Acinetobacter baumannii]